MLEHKVVASGVGWACTCGQWGWLIDKSEHKHLADFRDIPSPAEKSVDAAWEKNR